MKKRPLVQSPEFDLGNVVRLKKPYRGYRYGVIVQHVHGLGYPNPKLSLHLFTGRGRILMDRNCVPAYVDFMASDLILWKIAANAGKSPGGVFESGCHVINDGKGFDPYPTGRPPMRRFKRQTTAVTA